MISTAINTSKIARIALPIVTAGMIGASALGWAGVANASTSTAPNGPGYSYAPSVKARPAPEAQPGFAGRHGPLRMANLSPSYRR